MAESLLTTLVTQPLLHVFTVLYILSQDAVAWIFGPSPPPSQDFDENLPKKRVAIIGAGLTGVSSAAHCVSNGFDVQIFEAREQEKGLGGIWSVSLAPTIFRYLLVN